MIKDFQVLVVSHAHVLLNQAKIFGPDAGGGKIPIIKNVDCINDKSVCFNCN